MVSILDKDKLDLLRSLIVDNNLNRSALSAELGKNSGFVSNVLASGRCQDKTYNRLVILIKHEISKNAKVKTTKVNYVTKDDLERLYSLALTNRVALTKLSKRLGHSNAYVNNIITRGKCSIRTYNLMTSTIHNMINERESELRHSLQHMRELTM